MSRGISSASTELQQQLHRQVRSLTVEKLKKILRNANLTVTGNKAILVERIVTELDHRAQDTDFERFTRLRQLIQNPDNPPPLLSNSQIAPGYEPPKPYSKSPYTVYQPSSPGFNVQIPTTRAGPDFGAKLKFKASPFYTEHEELMPRRSLDVREQSRDVLTFAFRLRGDHLDRLRRDHRVRILFYCGTDEALRLPADIIFPSSFELKINELDVRANYKGLKNKPGTTRPVDVTDSINRNGGHENSVWLTWAVTSRRFHVVFYIARQSGPEELVRKLNDAKRISKSSVLSEMNAWASDPELIATSTRMSLKCPLSTMRIDTPCRSRICKHNQCFDALSFLQLQEQAPQWNCPVCNKQVPFESLQVDDYVDDILRSTPKSAEQVDIEPGGHWSLVGDDQEVHNSSSRDVKREDTTHSDDVVEIVDISNYEGSKGLPTPGLKRTNAGNRASIQQRTSLATPSSATKRSASEIIDLTGDTDEDDEEEPIRPPTKRHLTDSMQELSWGPAAYRPAQQNQALDRGFSFPIPSKPPQLPPGARFGP